MKVFIRPNEEGYIHEFSLSDIGNASEAEIENFDDFDIHYKSYKLVNGVITKDLDQLEVNRLEEQRQRIREQRDIECFPIINRGGLWYELLISQEKTELMEWYQAWLEATETLEIPMKPNWLK